MVNFCKNNIYIYIFFFYLIQIGLQSINYSKLKTKNKSLYLMLWRRTEYRFNWPWVAASGRTTVCQTPLVAPSTKWRSRRSLPAVSHTRRLLVCPNFSRSPTPPVLERPVRKSLKRKRMRGLLSILDVSRDGNDTFDN